MRCIEVLDRCARALGIVASDHAQSPWLSIAREKRARDRGELLEPLDGDNESAEQVFVATILILSISAHRRAHVELCGWKKSGVIDDPGEEGAQ